MKRVIWGVFVLTLSLTGKLYAAVDGGTCGDDCNWTFDTQTYTLTITGTKQDAYGPINTDVGVWLGGIQRHLGQM